MWTHAHPVSCHGGPGAVAQLTKVLSAERALLVTTGGMLRRKTARSVMASCPLVQWQVHTVAPNPELDALDQAAAQYRENRPDAIVALGGGSAMDSAKALAMALASARKRPLHRQLREGREEAGASALPIIAIPTTAGSGSEVTPFATIWDKGLMQKHSLARSSLYPRAALLDPELTLTLPWSETLWGALDAASHSLETLWNVFATPITLAFARQALLLVLDALPELQQAPDSLASRERMQQASLLGGLAISQNKTAIAHAVSYPLTLHFDMPHGLACGFTLAALVERVTAAGKWREPRDQALASDMACLLRLLELPALVARFCSYEQAAALLPQMFDPTRAGNFVLPVSREETAAVLRASI